MLDDLMLFSRNQLITVTAVSNYAGTGAGSAGAGVLDCGLLTPSPGGSGGFGQDGIFGGSPQRFMLTVSVTQVFAGPVGSTLLCGMQDSADNVTFNLTNLSMIIAANLTLLQIPGQVLLSGDLPAIGGSTLTALAVLRQYLRMLYTVGGGPFTAGAITAGIDVF
jgi:hypothetical protein